MNHLSLSIEALHESIVQGVLSATRLCELVLARIEERDRALGAMCDVITASALKEAGVIDRAVSRQLPVGQLAGIPIAIKSNIDTVPATCSAGLPHLNAYRPDSDADVVSRLRRAGAVIVGSAETDSGGFGVTSPGVSNPSFPDRIVGGSSGGSAAAVAAGFCKAAIGTDTGGSVRIPAACCGIVGFKPTFGRVSTEGVRPLASSVDHVGVLALSAGDARSVMEVIDPGFTSLPCDSHARLSVIGVPKAYVKGASPLVGQMFNEFVERCAKLGHALCEVELPHPDEILGSHLVLSLTEAALFYLESEGEQLDALPSTAKEGVQLGLTYKGHQHLRALRHKERFVRQMHTVFSQVDFVALPTIPVFPPGRSSSIVRVGEVDLPVLEALIRYTAPFDQSGHPALAMPWRQPNHQDVASIQLIGPLNSDRRLLALGESLERQIDGFGNAAVA